MHDSTLPLSFGRRQTQGVQGFKGSEYLGFKGSEYLKFQLRRCLELPLEISSTLTP